MLLYATTTSPYYFTVVIVPVLVLCLRLTTKVSKSTLPVTLPSVNINIDIKLGYPASTKLKSWHAISSKTVSTIIAIIDRFFFGLHFADPGDPAVRLLHVPLSTQTSLAIPQVLPSPLLPHMTHCHFISPYPRGPPTQYLPSLPSLPSSSPSKQ